MATDFSSSAVSRYIDRVRAAPRFDREQEHALAVRAHEGDRAAADRLVEANLRFAVAVALQYRRYGIPLSELIAEGNLGLMMAVRKFDPYRGTRFVTYAGYWIRAYVLDLVVKSSSMVGAGSGVLRSKVFFRLRRERARIANIEDDPGKRTEMLARQFDVEPDKMRRMLRQLDARDTSLDAAAYPDSNVTILETMVDPGIGQDEQFLDRERQDRLESHLGDALGILDSRERYIVERRIMSEDELSLAELGRRLGVSRERARQLEARAKRKLRERLAPAFASDAA